MRAAIHCGAPVMHRSRARRPFCADHVVTVKVAPVARMPLRVFVKLHKLIGLPPSNYRLWGDVNPLGVPFSSACAFVPDAGYLVSAKAIELSAGQRYGTSLLLRVFTECAEPHEVARLTLPLHWFPADRTVRDWFPFLAVARSALSADIEVHIIKRLLCQPFRAPAGNLLVLPAWNRPNEPALPPAPWFPPAPGFEPLTLPPAPWPVPTAEQNRQIVYVVPQVVFGVPASRESPPPTVEVTFAQPPGGNAPTVDGAFAERQSADPPTVEILPA
jgi:hypothetical protein